MMERLSRRVGKVILAWVMSVAMMTASFNVFAASTSENGTGDKVVLTTADEKTGIPEIEDAGGAGPFGKKAGEGRIWVDKSVINNNNGTFDINLSALNQEYTAVVANAAGTSSVTADVIFILDASGSMTEEDVLNKTGGKTSRMKALVDSTNNAIRIITKANPKNRFAVYFTNGINPAKELLPMDSYTLVNGQVDVLQTMFDYLSATEKFDPIWVKAISGTFPNDTYINLHLRNSADEIAGGSNYDPTFNTDNVGNASFYDFVNPRGGTPTQRSVVTGIQSTINKINASAETNEKMPFVFVMSDGGATFGNSNWWDTTAASGIHDLGKGAEGAESDDQEQLSDITANLILSSAFMKEKLATAYNDYNQKNGHPVHETKYYTLGLGSDINGPTILGGNGLPTEFEKYAWIGLQPEAIEPAINGDPLWSPDQIWDAKQTLAATNVKAKMSQYITLAKDAGITGVDKYNDPTFYDYSYYYKNAVSYAELEEAFGKLANDVASATTAYLPPVDEATIGTEAASIYFEDAIGKGFTVDDEIKIVIDKTTEIVGKNTVDNPGTYTFDGLEGKVIAEHRADGSEVVKWYLSGDDLKNCLYSILADGSGYKPSERMTLAYTVKPVLTSLVLGKSYYTNEFSEDASKKIIGGTRVSFFPSKMNPYYFYSNDKVGIVNDLAEVGYADTVTEGKDSNIAHFVKGNLITAIANGTELKKVYITTAMAMAEDCPAEIKLSQIGTLIDITVDTSLVKFNEQLLKTMSDCAPAENSDKASTEKTFGFLTGIQKPHSHTVKKVANNTKTAEMVSVEDFQTGKVTMTLGNNGLLLSEMKIEKAATASINAGGVINFKITVHNDTSDDKTGIVVKDVIASGLTNITNKTNPTVIATYSVSGQEVKWENVTVNANSSIDLVVEAQVPVGTAENTIYKNTAKIESVSGVKLTDSAQSNETKSTVTAKKVIINVTKDGSAWTDHNKACTLVNPSDPTKKYELTDSIPNGTYEIVTDGTNTKVTIVIQDGKGNATLNYFTLTLTSQTGIASVSGQGIYLQNTEVLMNATLQTGYEFAGWSGSYDLSKAENKIVMNRKLEFLAKAKTKDGTPTTSSPPSSPDNTTPIAEAPRNPDTADKGNSIWIAVFFASLVVMVGVLGYRIQLVKRKKTKSKKVI